MIQPETISAVLASFTLIGLAEMGDKSQIVCMALASRHRYWPVLFGAATAFVVSALGVWLGRTLLQRLPAIWLHRSSGAIFLVFACIAGWRAVS